MHVLRVSVLVVVEESDVVGAVDDQDAQQTACELGNDFVHHFDDIFLSDRRGGLILENQLSETDACVEVAGAQVPSYKGNHENDCGGISDQVK